MNRAKTARWASRLIALGMLVAALVAFRVMESQLRRLGESAQRLEDDRPEPKPPPSTRLPVVRLPAEPIPDELDSKTYVPESDGDEPEVPEELPAPGEVPEGAVW